MTGLTPQQKTELENYISAISEIGNNDEIDRIEKLNKHLGEMIQDIPAVNIACEKIRTTNQEAKDFQQEIMNMAYKLQNIVTESGIASAD